MKRILLSLLALLLALCMTFVGCDSTPPANNDNNQSGGGGTTTPPTQDPPADTPFTKTENYMPADVFAQMKAYFESTEKGFYPYDDLANAPLVSTDVFAISNGTVKSITIPVFSTGETDKNGDFIFSIYILPNAWSLLRAEMAEPADKIEVKINAEAHGLTENANAVRKFIKVDLSEYEIELSDKETLGFGHIDDTLIPARVLTKGTVDDLGKEKYAPAKYMIDNWDVVGYYYYNRSDPAFSYTDHSLLFDFEIERTYESEAAYNEMVAKKAADDDAYAKKLAAVKAAFAGKSFSLIGDSISTFSGVTNNGAINSTLPLNAVHYSIGTTVYDYTKTYWGKLSVDTGMDLCVINSWSGGKVYGTSSKDWKDNMLTRSYNLTTNDGKTPDLIFLYYAINDMLNSPSSVNPTSENDYTAALPTGNLYQRLSNESDTRTTKEIVAEWFIEVKELAATAGYNPADPSTIKPGQTFICWEAAYALSLQNILTRYENAEVFVLTLAEANHNSCNQPRLNKANIVLRALAEYFEVNVIDHVNSQVNKGNCHMYGRDTHGLHPNGKGHAAITRLIVEALYEKLPK
ncbi:MAG: hypothetical protein E7624_04050 [Ruminococcaceae bacterium]|nr:hypothetical protein [Oscillospiraceae bacterium]